MSYCEHEIRWRTLEDLVLQLERRSGETGQSDFGDGAAEGFRRTALRLREAIRVGATSAAELEALSDEIGSDPCDHGGTEFEYGLEQGLGEASRDLGIFVDDVEWERPR